MPMIKPGKKKTKKGKIENRKNRKNRYSVRAIFKREEVTLT